MEPSCDADPAPADLIFSIDGRDFPAPAGSIPKLFAVYVAAMRARHFAEVDSARGDGGYGEVFRSEVRHALRDRTEIKDWLENSMDVHLEPTDGITVRLAEAPPAAPSPESGAAGDPAARIALLEAALRQSERVLTRHYEKAGLPPFLHGDDRWEAMVAARLALADGSRHPAGV